MLERVDECLIVVLLYQNENKIKERILLGKILALAEIKYNSSFSSLFFQKINSLYYQDVSW